MKLVVTIIVLCAVGIFGFTLYRAPDKKWADPPPSDPRNEACFAGRVAVKQKLSRPEDANFAGDCLSASGVTEDQGIGKYIARGVFDVPDRDGIRRQHGFAVSVEIVPKGVKTFVLHID